MQKAKEEGEDEEGKRERKKERGEDKDLVRELGEKKKGQRIRRRG